MTSMSHRSRTHLWLLDRPRQILLRGLVGEGEGGDVIKEGAEGAEAEGVVVGSVLFKTLYRLGRSTES